MLKLGEFFKFLKLFSAWLLPSFNTLSWLRSVKSNGGKVQNINFGDACSFGIFVTWWLGYPKNLPIVKPFNLRCFTDRNTLKFLASEEGQGFFGDGIWRNTEGSVECVCTV